MIKKLLIICLVLALTLSLSACSSNTPNTAKDESDKNETDVNEAGANKKETNDNKAIDIVGKEYFNDDTVVAVVLNDLSMEKIDKYKEQIDVEQFTEYSTAEDLLESALIVPRYKNVTVTVYSGKMNDVKLEKDEIISQATLTDNGAYLLNTIRPEGMPIIVTLEGTDINEEYCYQFNGKDGTKEIDYVVKSN